MGEGSAVRVLVAEDEPLVRGLLKRELGEMGYLVVGEAGDGEKAVELALALRPDVVLMDLRMPRMGGVEATRLIASRCPMPVVVLTAHEDMEKTREAAAAGAGAYLVKPAAPRELERAIIVARARFADLQKLALINEDLKLFEQAVAHDLRGPMAHIVHICEACLKGDETICELPPEELFQMLHQSAKKTLHILQSLSRLVRLSGKDLPASDLEMGHIARRALERLGPSIITKHAQISVPETWPRALGEETVVEEVWWNYLSNALKYGSADGCPPVIELGWTEGSEGRIAFWVQDRGPGLGPGEDAKLFRVPFYRSTRARQGNEPGDGLGLMIVKGIVQRLGGEVGVQSTPGQGVRFHFTLPGAPR